MSGAYEAAVAYRAAIIAVGQMLAGDEPMDDPEFQTWQANAKRQARLLRRYAQFLEDCADGRVSGPIVFPSWRED